MAAGFWGGLNRSYQRKRLELREDKEREQQIFAKRREALFGPGGVTSELSPNFYKSKKKRDKEESTVSQSALAEYLQSDPYNVPDDVLRPIIASKDSTALERLKNILDEQFKAYDADKRPFPTDLVNRILERSVIEMPKNKPINFEAVEKYIGQPLSDLQKEILTTRLEKPGSVIFGPVEYAALPTLQDLEGFEKRVVTNIVNRANSDLDPITQRIAELNELRLDTTLNDVQNNELDWLSARKPEIEEALESYEKFNNVVPMVKLYGNTYVQEITKEYGKFEDAPINNALKDIAPANPIEVVNRELAQALMNVGIIKGGDVVLNLETGMLIPIQTKRN